MYKYNIKSIKIFIILLIITLNSCVNKKTYDNVIFKINDIETGNNNEIIFLNNE